MSAIIDQNDELSLRRSFERMSIHNHKPNSVINLATQCAKEIFKSSLTKVQNQNQSIKVFALLNLPFNDLLASYIPQMMVTLTIKQSSIIITILFIKNGQPQIINSQKIKIILSRMLNKTDFPWSNWIKCTLKQSKQLHWIFQYNCPQLLNIFLENRNKSLQIMKDHMKYCYRSVKLFYTKLVPILHQFTHPLGSEKPKVQFLQQLQIIKKLINISFMPNIFNSKGQITHVNQEDLQRINVQESFENKFHQIFLYQRPPLISKIHQNHFDLKQMIQNQHQDQNLNKNNVHFRHFNFNRLKQMFTTALKYPVQRNFNRFDNQFITSEIHILNPDKIKWMPFYEGGFGVLKKASVKYIAMEPSDLIENREHQIQRFKDLKRRSQNEIIQKTLLLKTQKADLGKKENHLKWEAHILNNLTKKKCGFLPRYFYTKQKNLPFLEANQSFLFTEHYKGKSLECWKENNDKLTTSFFSQITILFYVTYGLNFLHQNKIIHMDLKPSNILLDKKFITKIADYGQSYNEEVKEIMSRKGYPYRPGFTVPYAPPQIFKRRILSQKIDIFSFGIIIYQIFFGSSLFGGCDPLKLEKIYYKTAQNINRQSQKYAQWNQIAKNIFLCPERANNYFFAQMSFCVLNLILRCVSSNFKQRPNLLWIIIILKQINRCCQSYYSL